MQAATSNPASAVVATGGVPLRRSKARAFKFAPTEKPKQLEKTTTKGDGPFSMFGSKKSASTPPAAKAAGSKAVKTFGGGMFGLPKIGGAAKAAPKTSPQKQTAGPGGGFTLFGGGAPAAAKKSAAPKSSDGGGFKLGFGKSAPKAAQPTKKSPPAAGGFTLFGGGGGGGKPKTPFAATKATNVKKLEKTFKAPSAKPAVTRKSSSAGGLVTADDRRTGARKSPRDVKKELGRWYGPDRALYLPGGLLEKDEIKPWLTGTLAGDYGFDPLDLGKDQQTVSKYREYELLHARWAMLAIPGVVFPEALGVKGGTWFETGRVALEGNLNYTAPPLFTIENPLPLPVIALIQIGLMGLVEKYRSEGEGPSKGWAPVFGAWDEASGSIWKGLDSINPGGPLNPFGAAGRSPEDLQLMKVREIKNGRLAMIVMLGVFVQAAVTGEGPYANWAKHVADPFAYNLTTILNQDLTSL